MQHVWQARGAAVCLHTLERGQLAVILMWVCIGDVIGHDCAVCVYLHAVIDGIAIGQLGRRDVGQKRIAVHRSAAYCIGRAHAVSFDQMQAQCVRQQRRCLHTLDQGKNVAAHGPRQRDKLLHPIEVIHAGCVAGALIARPQRKLSLYKPLPVSCLLL